MKKNDIIAGTLVGTGLVVCGFSGIAGVGLMAAGVGIAKQEDGKTGFEHLKKALENFIGNENNNGKVKDNYPEIPMKVNDTRGKDR